MASLPFLPATLPTDSDSYPSCPSDFLTTPDVPLYKHLYPVLLIAFVSFSSMVTASDLKGSITVLLHNHVDLGGIDIQMRLAPRAFKALFFPYQHCHLASSFKFHCLYHPSFRQFG